MKTLKAIIITVWILIGLYFGIGGYMSVILLEEKVKAEKAPENRVTIDDIDHRNIEEFIWYNNKTQLEVVFPWLIKVPQALATIITALSFGIIGGVTRLIKQITFEESMTIKDLQVFNIPVLGMLSGIIMLGLSFILPTILTSGDNELRPTTLIFLTLFAGLFSKRFYEWLNSSFHIIFPQPK